MRKAGNIFGLDLAALFDEEGETTEGFEGFAPTFKMFLTYCMFSLSIIYFPLYVIINY